MIIFLEHRLRYKDTLDNQFIVLNTHNGYSNIDFECLFTCECVENFQNYIKYEIYSHVKYITGYKYFITNDKYIKKETNYIFEEWYIAKTKSGLFESSEKRMRG